MNTTMKKISALALATAALSAATLVTSIASANAGNVHDAQPLQDGIPGGNVHGPIQGNVHGPNGVPPRTVTVTGLNGGNVHGPVPGNLHGVNGVSPGTVTVTGLNGGNVHGPGIIEPTRGTGVIAPGHGPVQPAPSGSPQAPNPPGQVISCHPGTGCTLSPAQPPVDRDQDHDHDHDHDHDRDYDHDHDHDRDHDRDHWRWSHSDNRGWDFPVIAVTGYAPDSCVYEYKFRTVYVPGAGLERALVKVCEAY